MSRTTECDVLVVGAGPAGSSAALAAAERGARTVVVERRAEIGVPAMCAGLVPAPLLLETPACAAALIQRTSGIATHLPGSEVQRVAAPGVMLERERFDQLLASAAALAGADVRTGMSLSGIRGGAATVIRAGEAETVRPAVIIGADGPRSQVGESVGLVNRDFAAALQVEVLLEEPLSEAHVFFDPMYRGGYGWLFPRGETANLGVGVEAAAEECLDEALEHLLKHVIALGLVLGRHVLARTGGPIPVGGPLGDARRGRVLLAGDAAGQTHPITGAGIHAAVSCGRVAGAAAAAYAASGDETDLARYEREWKLLWGDVLATAVARRRELLALWDADFARAVRGSWVTFPEYHARRRPAAPAGRGAGRRPR